ncbi:MAG: AbrB/MazE/SpoVT family DNA-binding domain-containing protein [Gemmatimonadaceae bacterium]
MTVIKSKITSKRQVTVPKEVCESLGLGAGDEIEWTVTRAGIRVRRGGPPPSFEKWRGYLKQVKTADDTDALIESMRGR